MADFPISSLPSETLTSDTLLLGSMPDGLGGYDSGKFDAQAISGIVVKHMAQTDYDDLSPAEKNNGTLYITDGTPPSEAVTGSDVLYFSDVSDSNKPKSTTAAAVATVLNIEDLKNVTITTSDNNKLLGVSVSGDDISVGAVGELFKRVQFANSASITVPANGAVNITANDLNIITPTGYTPVAISSLYSSSNSVVMRSFNCFATGTSSFGVARNVSGSSESVIFNVAILYIKSGFVSIVNPT